MNRFLVLFAKRTQEQICRPLFWICWSVGSHPWKTFQRKRVLEGGIYEDQINLPQPQETPGSEKKVLADLRVRRPDSSRIQLGISYSTLTMIWLKRWGICCKDDEIFQSPPVQNWETVSGILAPSDNPAIFAKEVEAHHLSFHKLIKEFVPTVQEV